MADNKDILAEMLGQTERDYVGWNPDEKPQVAGIVADIATDCDCGGFGTHNIIFIDEGDGENGTAVHCFHTTLRSQVDSKIRTGKLAAGDLIAIAYRGTQASKTKGHADINVYRVVIRPRTPAVQFGADGVEYDDR